jgi:uncharacterized protein DUF4019
MPKTAIAFASILLLICGFGSLNAGAAGVTHTAAKATATKAATAWLRLIDEGDYAASWNAAGSYVKEHVTEDQWTQKVGPARQSLGTMVSRKLKSATYMTTLPGAPDGQYVVIQYQTSFAHKKSAVETVTPMFDKDRQWRVSGYYIR